jgi:hypothetical protein
MRRGEGVAYLAGENPFTEANQSNNGLAPLCSFYALPESLDDLWTGRVHCVCRSKLLHHNSAHEISAQASLHTLFSLHTWVALHT